MAGVKPASGDVALLLLLLLVCITLLQCGSTEGLTVGFYNKICPGAEAAITNAVKSKFNTDKSVVPGILRLYFHDCFVRVSNFISYTHTGMRLVHEPTFQVRVLWLIFQRTFFFQWPRKYDHFEVNFCVNNLNLWNLWEFVIGKVRNESLIAKSNCNITVSWDFFRDLIAQVEAVLVNFPLGAVIPFGGCVCLILSHCLNLSPFLVYENCEDWLYGWVMKWEFCCFYCKLYQFTFLQRFLKLLLSLMRIEPSFGPFSDVYIQRAETLICSL